MQQSSRKLATMNSETIQTAHAAQADDELLFLCPDRDAVGFVQSDR